MLGLFKNKGDSSGSGGRGMAASLSRAALIVSPSSNANSKSSAAAFSVKTLRNLYSQLLAEISTSTNGAWIEAWGRLGGANMAANGNGSGGRGELGEEDDLEEGIEEQVR